MVYVGGLCLITLRYRARKLETYKKREIYTLAHKNIPRANTTYVCVCVWNQLPGILGVGASCPEIASTWTNRDEKCKFKSNIQMAPNRRGAPFISAAVHPNRGGAAKRFAVSAWT